MTYFKSSLLTLWKLVTNGEIENDDMFGIFMHCYKLFLIVKRKD